MRSTEYVIIIYYNTYVYIYIYLAHGSCVKNYIFADDDSAGTRPCALLNCAENMFSFKLPHNINRITPIRFANNLCGITQQCRDKLSITAGHGTYIHEQLR